jgi:hypothetical protein
MFRLDRNRLSGAVALDRDEALEVTAACWAHALVVLL